jgi:secreted PhoX family phosphatase
MGSQLPADKLPGGGNSTMTERSRLDRRQFLTRSALAAGAMTVGAPFDALLARGPQQPRRGRGPSPDYGPLQPAIDETTGLPLLLLPADFRYVSFGWTGELMSDGIATPGVHDGMAAFPGGRGRVHLIRNHEVGDGPDAFAPAIAYDEQAGGGTTTLEFDTLRGRLVHSYASISGTVRNCAGGPTPWGSWLTCEETTISPGAGRDLLKNHGYIFEVPVHGQANTTPYADMGRFSHEAVAIDPSTGDVYETEDAGDDSGMYRFRPHVPGQLQHGGVLEMLGVAGRPQFDTRTGQTGDWLDLSWHTIDNPDPDLAAGEVKVFTQGYSRGAARFGRLEGAWYGNGRIYFVSTSGGNARQGQVFELDPLNNRMRLLFESPSADVLNAPDNICVSPRGGLVLCEDGSGAEFVHGLTTDGVIFRFAQNNVDLRQTPVLGFNGNYTGSEVCGACYSPDGKWLFFNIQSPGITFAVTGPWGSGGL